VLVQKLNIKEFRGIKSCKEPINLSSFTVLIGRNNSGKSTILEALSLLPTPNISDCIVGGEKIDFLKDLHRPRRSPGSGSNEYKSLIYLYAGTSIIEYYINNKVLKIILEKNKFQVLSNGENILVNNQNVATFYNENQVEGLENLVLFIPNDTSFIKKLEIKMKSLKELITKRGYHVNVAKSLSKCVDDEYSEIVFLDPISIRKVFPNNFTYIQLRDLGSGAEKAVKIMSLIEAINPKLLLIDDFGASLHPSLIKIVLKWLKNKKWQTIISTHSIDVLYKLVKVNPANATVLQLYKSNEDVLSHKVLTLENLEDFLNANTDPRLLVDALGL